ncbi:G-type lectin S-receptor-like serine/threonine-protein kinase LECRK3 [Diospyros lotus]|uniref:G-type lectin S-receptor-like serine/threonine-protein kinase LECRK3 n=1 Tax=Diospyros lotus TaxID=55363 RepID=UPI00225BB68C|nr:G-type lectin S-receptor-like serine/threonine-protein kinase LECRK3 [Diospyros lotus]
MYRDYLQGFPCSSNTLLRLGFMAKSDWIDLTMAHALLFLLFLLPLSIAAQSNGTIALGKSITANTDAADPWLSPSADFAFGFRQLEDPNLFLLSIWYYKIPDRTIVWFANEGVPFSSGSKVELTSDKGLVVTDPKGNVLWESEGILNEVAYGFLNDTGNFVLMGSDSLSQWESFEYPTDTLLPTQTMKSGLVLYSKRSVTNFSQGRFQLRFQDGNLLLNTRDMVSNLAYANYYTSNTSDPSNPSNSGQQVIFPDTGYMYILRENGVRFNLTPRTINFPASDNYHRATLNFDGVFVQYAYPRSSSTGNTNWSVVWSEPDNICAAIGGGLGSGACGFNNICSLGDDKRPICQCPPGFSLMDPDDKYGSCRPNFTQSCEEADVNSAADVYDFSTLVNTNWPTSDYEHLKPLTESQCRNNCLQDCFCAVAILGGDECWKKKLPLSNGIRDSSLNNKAILKYRKVDVPPSNPTTGPPTIREKKDRESIIVVGSVLLGTSFFVNLVLVGAFCLGFFFIYRKKKGLPTSEISLRSFTYKELDVATNGFGEELGRGAFGIVYKGVVQMGGSRQVVAVKKLDRVAQQKEKEFKTEVNVIGRTHHKNLVRLLGFCEEGQHRMLVYEFLTNGTLSSFLFGDTKPSWNLRTEIALGIARGLVYLHEECTTQIIHCDIKPQNILLDEYYNARISDFGLAKLLRMNQSKTVPTTIRGTKGYVASEWFNNKPITAKVDVYSYGVLLLEIISCQRSVGDLENGEVEKAILTDWASDCLEEGKLEALVENDREALDDWNKLMRFVMVAIWCIQEDPSFRPSMRKVIQMLEEVIEVNRPPCPTTFSSTT